MNVWRSSEFNRQKSQQWSTWTRPLHASSALPTDPFSDDSRSGKFHFSALHLLPLHCSSHRSLIHLSNSLSRFQYYTVSWCSSVEYFGAKILSNKSLLGAGVGLTTSANSLALNTYFRERRRIVTGISWSCTALGPIVFPHIVTVLLPFFGVQGTVLIFSGIAMNAVCCSLLLQPVRWHTKSKPKESAEEALIRKLPEIECRYCQSKKKRSMSIMSSQYLHNADSYLVPGYEIIDPGTPMMARANDGWFSSSSAKRSQFGSKMSLTSRKASAMGSIKASNQNLVMSNRPSYVNLGTATSLNTKQNLPKEVRPIDEKIDECPSEDCPSHKSPQDLQLLTVNAVRNSRTSPATPSTSNPPFLLKQISENKYLRDNKSNRSMQSSNRQSFRIRTNTFNIEKEVLSVASHKLEQYVNDSNERVLKCTCEEVRLAYMRDVELQKQIEEEFEERDKPKFTFWQKFVIFFDLDLLKDLTYINIMVRLIISTQNPTDNECFFCRSAWLSQTLPSSTFRCWRLSFWLTLA